MFRLEASPSDVIKIEIPTTNYTITLDQLSMLTVDFFNGFECQAPSSVLFTINDAYSNSVPLTSAKIVDGYQEALFNPLISNTGQIVRFESPIESFITGDGYQNIIFSKLAITFLGQPKYSIGEIEALVDTTIVNSRCRIVLNDEELFLSKLLVSNVSMSRYEIQVNKGSLFVFFGGSLILSRPILFTHPIFEFGASGKTLDDLVIADFKNIFIDQFFTISPAKIQKIGRFVEIEGTVIS